jgi:hypothetical protein
LFVALGAAGQFAVRHLLGKSQEFPNLIEVVPHLIQELYLVQGGEPVEKEVQQESERDAALQGSEAAGSVDICAVGLNINHIDYLAVPGYMRIDPVHSENGQNRKEVRENCCADRLVEYFRKYLAVPFVY